MRPAWSISADGTDLTDAIRSRLIRLTITDQAGLESDTLDLSLADPRGEIALPALGARLEVSIGYQGAPLVRVGAYLVDGVELSSAPRVLTIHAAGADLTASLRDRRTEAYEATTVGATVAKIAKRHGLTPAVSDALGSRQLQRVDQTNESDIGFLTRLGNWFDALVSIKDGRLVFVPHGRGVSASGRDIGAVTLTEADVLSWRYQHSREDLPTTIEARVYDHETATDTRVSALVPARAPGKLADLFAAKEQQYGLPAGLLTGIAKTESGFNPNARSPAGAQGMFQFMPGTARQYAVNPWDVPSSADGAARYLRDLHRQFGDWDKAIAAYNAGPGNIAKGRYPAETRAYVPKVKRAMAAAVSGDGAKVQLRQSFADRALAQTAATSAATAAARNSRRLHMQMPGRPSISAETPIQVQGFGAEIDGRWTVTTATHQMDSGGYVTEVDAVPETSAAETGPATVI